MKEGHITVEGNRLFTKFHPTTDLPEKPTVVFLHEGLGSVAQWKDFPETIAENTGLSILSYDRLGHGLSNARSKKKTRIIYITKPGPYCPVF